ncbi:glycoside hydrolase family 18 protein [Methylobacterium oxalidis]|uniref:Chitinase II/V-like catalytic domain-containing protein n=1 Tax=Methylobacterium oxalidis TaxID=944322 RepID=A0A512J5K1_9HYPH|nr:glycoside hydrolase family 18 protein [Methylobacterium oxalidis]GEP05238.1 hypothetical protein MOX02_32760 [Methylobacterium oxalidis]GJE34237.1 hypothetical protein LDDCCGHA_4444 [Methylobacterium oxalidis]GLS66344.1 hypothetical protein GCM10007888_47270 [Methylobacterium oxalidis]
MKLRSACAVLVTLAVTAGSALSAAHERPPVQLAAYYATWAADAESASGLDDRLVRIPDGVTEVLLAFMRPDATYAGNLDLTGTGVQVPYSGSVLKASLQALKERRPGIRVMVSIGGEEYANWAGFDARSIRRFVEDFGLDGVDLDFEPRAPNCRVRAGRTACDSDALLLDVVEAARSALPRPIAIWLTATNTGAFGEGAWREAGPTGGPTYGAFLPLLRDPTRRALLDGISIMAYDAGPTYRPLEAYAAYRNHFQGPILIGFTSPPEAWGGHVYTLRKAVETLGSALEKGANGAMIFAIGKDPPPDPGPERPSPDELLAVLAEATGRARTD